MTKRLMIGIHLFLEHRHHHGPSRLLRLDGEGTDCGMAFRAARRDGDGSRPSSLDAGSTAEDRHLCPAPATLVVVVEVIQRHAGGTTPTY